MIGMDVGGSTFVPHSGPANAPDEGRSHPRMPYQYPMPKETLPDLVVPHAIPIDDRVWVPQGENVWFRPSASTGRRGIG
jgi:hypothetical protein